MKNKLIVLILIVLVIILIISLVLRKKVEIKDIDYFSFSYTNGYAINSNVLYELNYKDYKYIAIIKPNEVSEEDKKTVVVKEDTIKRIEDVLKKYNVQNWNNFSKFDKNVLDGDSFTLNIKLKNGQTISANGYMKWPKNYNEVKNELDIIFMELYNR